MNAKTPRGFWSAWTAVAVDLIGFGIVIPLLPLYAESFGASPLVIGALFASYSLAQFVMSPIWGRLSDRTGRRPILLITIAGSAIGALITGFAGSLPILFLGRIVDGASGSSLAVARATVADIATDEDRPRLMGLLGAAFGVGFVIGPAIGALAALGSAALPFFAAASISIVNFFVTLVRLPETRRETTDTTEPEAASGTRLSSLVLRLIALHFIVITGFSAFEATFALLGNRRLGMSESTVAIIFAAVGIVLALTQGVLVGRAATRFGELGNVRAGLALTLVGYLLLAVATTWPLLIMALGLLTFGQGLIIPSLASAIAGADTGDTSGLAFGWQQSAGGMARVVGPLAGGALFAITTGLPYVVAAGLAGLALILLATADAPARVAVDD